MTFILGASHRCKSSKTQRFGNGICFRNLVTGEARSLLS